MKTQTIYLSTGNTQLKGRYRNGHRVRVICNATNGDFTIQLPECGNNEENHFSFYREDEVTDYTVYIVPNLRKKQKINNEDIQELWCGSTMDLETDGKHWHIS